MNAGEKPSGWDKLLGDPYPNGWGIFFVIVGFFAILGAGMDAVGFWQCKSALKQAGMAEPAGLRCKVADHRAEIAALLRAGE